STRRRDRRRGIAALAALVALVVASPVATASASRLDVRAEPAAIVTRTACTATAVQVVPTTTTAPTALRLDGLTAVDQAACAGRPVDVTLFGASGVVGTAQGTLTGATQTYPLTGSPTPTAVTRVRVLVGGFAVPATWRVPGPAPDSCRVVKADGSASTTPCTVTGTGAPSFWTGNAYWTVYFSAPGIQQGEHVEFEITVPDHAVPSGWVWSAATVVQVNNSAQLTSRCADLPTIRGKLPANIGATPEVQVRLTTQGGMPPLCLP
ncbi:hypothetical protein, partial [Cellulomonas algicola]|uniref:hypothetical protein n=1 Tax=Cellulomonas algicola TaxID=2071633 RepID=UPI0013569457